MRRLRQVVVFVAGAAAVWGAGPLVIPGAAGAWAVAPSRGAAGSWGRAIEVPGLGALNKGGNAGVSSVSCTSAANCAAGGSYRDGHRHYQGFVAGEWHGRWGRAIEVPALGALNKGGNADVSKVSCTSAGNCAAGGNYRDGSGHFQGFVVSEKNGRWGRAIEVPGLGALNKGGNAGVGPVSCTSIGNCAAAGDYTDGSGHRQGFAVSEKNGRWSRALRIRGMGGVGSMSCASAGNCSASYGSSVVDEKNGVWGQAIEVPGLGALNTGGTAWVYSVSCGSAGNCAAGGYYTNSSFYQEGFVASEKNGVWGQAIEVPGLGAWNDGTDQPMADVRSVSCISPGNCLAGGDVGGPYGWAWVASERNGVWGQASGVPGLQAIVSGRWANLGSVSCVSPGNCAVGGDYENPVQGVGPEIAAFVAVQRNGRWDQAINVPGLKALTKAGGDVASVSCGSPGHCTAGGWYGTSYYGRGPVQGFVT